MQVEELVYFMLNNEISYTDSDSIYQCQPILNACNLYREMTGQETFRSWYAPVCYLFNSYLNTRFELAIDMDVMRYSSKMSLEMLVEKMIATENKFSLTRGNLSSIAQGAHLITGYCKLFDLLFDRLSYNVREDLHDHKASLEYIHALQSQISTALLNACSENGQLVLLLVKFHAIAIDSCLKKAFNFINNSFAVSDLDLINVDYNTRQELINEIAINADGLPKNISYMKSIYTEEENMHRVINDYSLIFLSLINLEVDVFRKLRNMTDAISSIKNTLTDEMLYSISFDFIVVGSASKILDFIKNHKRTKQPTLADLKFEIDVLFYLTEHVADAILKLVMKLKLAREKMYINLMCQELDADGLRSYFSYVTLYTTDKKLFPKKCYMDNNAIRTHDYQLFSYASKKVDQLSWITQRQVGPDDVEDNPWRYFPAI